ncbi:class II glutamine amidotransferase [Amycolatopsis sp. FDAARGOS 1241]|uniref:class II glutamine amidotransferase n=1 Tax=Amycolatopsis sp. FDAARGOS 1241 TaxID=2778070 RepID=UPI0019527F26|nr:class II glutamine amidotransferase [Amycolatopsis sp. FDAARGOS 1241]QRP42663.1 class II glutamine amidotransferase [Amycolatopsis sp. FDAARGOS 1241]
MCRLFGLSAGTERVHATFWLLNAPDSLAAQSHRDPDGTGLGTFDADGTPRIRKQPLAAYADRAFAREAKDCESRTFLAHIRFASTGGLEPRNTHPFTQHGRLFAHNGVISDLDVLDAQLGDYRDLVKGDTDSERFFALITKHTDERHGNVSAGLTSAARWVAAHLPLYALNVILTTPDELWALRYPGTHHLYYLHRPAGGVSGDRHLEHTGTAGRIRAHCAPLAQRRCVTVASEPMDDEPGWIDLQPGRLLHVAPDLTVTRRTVLEQPPRHLLTLDDLGAHAAASQQSA